MGPYGDPSGTLLRPRESDGRYTSMTDNFLLQTSVDRVLKVSLRVLQSSVQRVLKFSGRVLAVVGAEGSQVFRTSELGRAVRHSHGREQRDYGWACAFAAGHRCKARDTTVFQALRLLLNR